MRVGRRVEGGGGMKSELGALLDSYYEAFDGSETLEAYHARHGTKSAGILTVTNDEISSQITEYLRPRIEGKIVVEIGAGIGLLACHLATVAARVYAIEVDPNWTSCFLAALYEQKPPNLTFIFGAAEQAPPFAADVAVFCTHSGHEAMHAAGRRFAPEVIDVYAELLRGVAPVASGAKQGSVGAKVEAA